ncbi:MAG: efflux RND transporter permease subunit [Syntrophobacteraceae bacterium]|nr:efflux RND transporter permease subunit [Syntrophobacteraceae bacterium]
MKQARAEGMEREEALIQAVRLRPVLMTTVSTFVGMLPIVLETAIGLERMSPLASAAGLGLLVGTIMTMVATPALYSCLDDVQTSWRSIWERR